MWKPFILHSDRASGYHHDNILITKGCIGRRIGIPQRIRVTTWNQTHINYTKCVKCERVGITSENVRLLIEKKKSNRTEFLRREESLMSAYLNVNGFEIVLPFDVLESMGCPSYITIIHSVANHKMILVPLKRRPKDAEIGTAKVPDKVYRRKAAFAFAMGFDFKAIMQEVSIAHSLFKNVQVDTDVVFISDLDLAAIAEVPKKDLVSNISVSLNFATLRIWKSVKDAGIIEAYSTGGYAVSI